MVLGESESLQNILNDHVDYFVIIEGNKTWQNNFKKFKFDINKYKKFSNKIIYIKVEDLPDGKDPYLRENHQRNCISRGLLSIMTLKNFTKKWCLRYQGLNKKS